MSSSTGTIEPSVAYGDMVSRLSRTLAAANRFLTQEMEREGISGIVPSHGDILVQLFAHEALPMTTLADRIGKDPSTVTALVKKLIAAGYVETTKSPADHRVTEVRLTSSGRSLQSKIARINERLLSVMAAGLTDAELIAARTTLEVMQHNFEKERP